MTHVMILEDDRASMEALAKILMEYSGDVCVHTASSYDEAKALLDADIRYGLFLLDVNLGGENREDIGGILFAREVRERFCYTFTPVVMITAVGEMEMQAYRELHCYQYIMKPFLPEQVREVVRKVLGQEKQEEPPSIMVKRDGVNYQVRCEDIRYIEAVHRGVCLHLKEEDWKIGEEIGRAREIIRMSRKFNIADNEIQEELRNVLQISQEAAKSYFEKYKEIN